MPDTLKLAIVTDIHHGPEKGTKRGGAALGLLDGALEAAAGWGADLLLEMGDRISDVDPRTDAGLLREVARAFAGSRLPRRHLLGNHDCACLSVAANEDALQATQAHASIDLAGWHLVFWQPDPHVYPQPFRLAPGDLEWLRADLAASALPTVVFSHVPLDSGSMLGNRYFERNPQFATYQDCGQIRAVLETSGRVKAAIAGHVHWNTLNQVNGIPYVALQSLTESFTVPPEPAAAWSGLELSGEAIAIRVHGRDPLRLRLPVRPDGAGWSPPLPPFAQPGR